MNSKTNSTLWCATYYLVAALVGGCEPFLIYSDSLAEMLVRIAISLPPAYWLIRDAKFRGIHVPHVIQPAIAGLWVFVVPVYILLTRKWWGLLYVTLHLTCTLIVYVTGYAISVSSIWPMVFSGSGG
ncbi:hypothetical protein N9Z53_02065 [Mariniblastus sp.]|nr:hypothetical protein [bacterium]MDA7924268.1 hypothetical protein [Mariniblastus sp.]MDB4372539.1 hypothetical protein [Mariniblastus sp.]MDB4380027.1 hypothetical protein [Mariniblastus sp.]